MSNWSDTTYSADAKKRSIREAREKIRQERLDEEELDAMCHCANPVPGYPKMGQRWCRACGRIVT